MKKKIVLFLFLIFFAALSAYSQTPTYQYRLMNDVQVSSKIYEFDVYLVRTGDNVLEVANTQFGITFNSLIKNGGVLTFALVAGTSEFVVAQQPQAANLTVVAAANYVRMTPRTNPGPGNGTLISNVAPGTRLGRFRITNSVDFGANQPNLAWNFLSTGGMYPSKLSAYVAGLPADVTVQLNHKNEDLGNHPLPVQLASFTGNVENKRDVNLTWKTSTEINNKGFEVERKQTDGSWSKVGYIDGKGTTNTPVDYRFEDKKLNTGKYNYRLKQIDNNGNFEYYNLATAIEVGVPTKYDMSQNYPNPFNPTTKIDFDLPLDSRVSITLYDISGREVKTLVNEQRTAGYYTIQFNSAGLSSGTYFYRIITKSSGADYIMTKKMVLVK